MPRRVSTALILIVIGLPAIILGGFFYFLLMAVVLTGSAWEFVRLFRGVQMQPNEWVTVGGVLALVTARMFFSEIALVVLALLVLLAMAVHVIAFERGRDQAALDFCVTVTGLVYLGWLGSYLLDLRNLEQGMWWWLIVLPMVWAADTGAYFIGSSYGRHKMTPRLSPKKSWEGYAAGVLSAMGVGAFFTYAFSALGPKPLAGSITPWLGALLGLLIGALAPLGDLGESMLKRQSGLKDSSNIFPGHGGFLDRIDSWIWAAVIGFFVIQYFIL